MIGYHDLATAFQARHLAVSMADAVTVDSGTLATEAAARLRAGYFDQAPVVDAGAISGFVLTRHLEGAVPRARVGSVMTTFGPDNVVSADAPVASLLEWIIGPGLLFVLDGREISGFVTVADFNKQPARAYFYLLLATIEIGLADLARHRFGAEQTDLLALLGHEEAEAMEQSMALDREANLEGDHVSYLEFSQLLRIVGRDRELLASVSYQSRNAWENATGALVGLRHEIMHPVRTLVGGKGHLIRLQGLEGRLRSLAAGISTAVASLGENAP